MQSAQHKTINIIGVTQGSWIDVFIEHVKALEAQGLTIGKVASYVSFARHFQQSAKVRAAAGTMDFVKEWEIFAQAKHHHCNLDRLHEFEGLLEPGYFWNAVICDRRLIHGPNARFRQDYRCLYDDRFLYALIDHSLDVLTKMLDQTAPSILLGYGVSTFGEYLLVKLAQARGIPFLQLRSAKIEDYVVLNEAIEEPSKQIKNMFGSRNFTPAVKAEAAQILQHYQAYGLKYEGVGTKQRKPSAPVALIKAGRRGLSASYHEGCRLANPVQRADHHDPGFIRPWFWLECVKPINDRLVRRLFRISNRQVTLDDLQAGKARWAFFPLHHEPEVELQIYGRPYHKDQSELIRWLAMSLPVGMNLLIKEHPRSQGQRPVGYYRKLLQIPNLYWIDPDTASAEFIKNVEMVAVINGVIGLEAALIGKPVLIFGSARFTILPESMVRTCRDLFRLPELIAQLLMHYRYDEEVALDYISVLITNAIRFNTYSVVLGKSGRVRFETDCDLAPDQRYSEQIKRLAVFTIKRMRDLGISISATS